MLASKRIWLGLRELMQAMGHLPMRRLPESIMKKVHVLSG